MPRPIPPSYDRTRAETLLRQFHDLSTFDDADEWDAASAAEQRRIQNFMNSTTASFEAELKAWEDAEQREYEQKPWWVRLLTSREYRDVATRLRSAHQAEVAALRLLNSRLYERAGQTPNDADDKREILADLRAMKADLATEIREIKVEAKRQHREGKADVRSSTRTGTSKAERLTAYIELDNDMNAQLREADQLERKKLEIEKLITWVTRFRTR